MHQCKIIVQISLILSVLNPILAAPMVVQEIHEARGPGDDPVAFGMAATSSAATRSGELETASDRATPPPSSPDAMSPPRHSSLSDGTTSSGYSAPYLSLDSHADSSYSSYAWLMKRPPRLSLHPPASHESAFHASSSGPSGIPIPVPLDHELENFNPNPSEPSSGSMSSISTLPTPTWLQELEHTLEMHVIMHGASTESSSERFTPSYHPSSVSSETIPPTEYASASAGSLSSHYFSASDGLAPSLNQGSPDSPPTSPPENAKFLTEDMVKKLKIVGGLTVIGAIIAGIATPLIKHRDYKDSDPVQG